MCIENALVMIPDDDPMPRLGKIVKDGLAIIVEDQDSFLEVK
jgi:hypothetical protein